MANSKQSIKRARQNADRYKLKHSQRSQARTAVKAVRNAIAENNKESATELLKTAEKVLDSTAAKKVIHKNAAARTKSRLVKAVKAISLVLLASSHLLLQSYQAIGLFITSKTRNRNHSLLAKI